MAQEIRNYRFTVEIDQPSNNTSVVIAPITEHWVIEAYDLNEALVQFGIKTQSNPVRLVEVIPFKYAEEQNPVTEQKKEVHVKPNIVRTK